MIATPCECISFVRASFNAVARRSFLIIPCAAMHYHTMTAFFKMLQYAKGTLWKFLINTVVLCVSLVLNKPVECIFYLIKYLQSRWFFLYFETRIAKSIACVHVGQQSFTPCPLLVHCYISCEVIATNC